MHYLFKVKVPGTPNTVDATLIDGQIWITLPSVCNSLGIHQPTQQDRLKLTCWAKIERIPLVTERGREQTMYVIDRRTLTMWLATLGVYRNKATRKTLEAYQKNIDDVLDRLQQGLRGEKNYPAAPLAEKAQ